MNDDPTESKKYVVIVQLEKATSYVARLREVVPEIQDTLNHLTNGEYELAFQSRDGSMFGYLAKTHVPIRVLKTQLIGTGRETGATLLGDDIILVLGIDEFDGTGFSNAWTWLQRH